MAPSDAALTLYDGITGERLTDNLSNISAMALIPDQLYYLKVNMPNVRLLSNNIKVDYYDINGVNQTPDFHALMRLKIFREFNLQQRLTADDNCQGTLFVPETKILAFRAPKHMKYYENDGQLHFNFSSLSNDQEGCQLTNTSLMANFDDLPAAPALPSFTEYNATHFPGEIDRNNHPYDTFHVRLVRFGERVLATEAELSRFGEQIESQFSTATKGYFNVVVDGVQVIPYLNENNEQIIRNWYARLPKTSNRDILDLEDPRQLYLATLLYYKVQGDGTLLGDVQLAYPKNSNGEDYTIYLLDGGLYTGQSMGAGAGRTKVNDLPDYSIFWAGAGINRSYHFTINNCYYCRGESLDQLLDRHVNAQDTTSTLTTVIHEMAHTLWTERYGIHLDYAHGSKQNIPLHNPLYENYAMPFFARKTILSYYINPLDRASIKLDDSDLEWLIEAASAPRISVNNQPTDTGQVSLFGMANLSINLDFHAHAASGVSDLWYQLVSAPDASAMTPVSGSALGLVADSPLTEVQNVAESVNLRFPIPGEYVFEFGATDRLSATDPLHHAESSKRLVVNVELQYDGPPSLGMYNSDTSPMGDDGPGYYPANDSMGDDGLGTNPAKAAYSSQKAGTGTFGAPILTAKELKQKRAEILAKYVTKYGINPAKEANSNQKAGTGTLGAPILTAKELKHKRTAIFAKYGTKYEVKIKPMSEY